MGRAVKKAMIDQGITQRELAELLGIQLPALSRALHGRRSGETYWPRIIEVLGMTPQGTETGGADHAHA